ncbi:MAG: O-antigen ligase domain-containing protein [Anaerolineae bacterium]|nr:MAG: O-antigen ligase domain-containing protein [Anaerolineae bacterium]
MEAPARFLWALVLLTLPVTSFRYFPFLGRSTQVRPLAAYPLALLLPLLLVRLWRRRRTERLPGSLILFAFFALVVLLMTAIGALYAPPELRGQTYWGRALRAWVTVGLGLAFFLAALQMNRSEADLRFSLKWLFIGFALDVVWSGVQAVTFYTPLLEKRVVTLWQRAFSLRELVGSNRVSGMAYEPAWLAGQIATLYLPWLVAALLTRYPLHRRRILTVALLLAAGGLLLLTYSRGGILVAVAASGLTILLTGRESMARVWEWFGAAFRSGNLPLRERLWGWILRLGAVVLLLTVPVGAFLVLSQKGYFSNLWSASAESLVDYVIANYAGARMAYAVSAARTFLTHPWTGVGLGASGFYIYGNLPEWALTRLPEIARHLSPESHLYPNPKNIYLRLLAESGLPGFVFFAAFYLSVLGDILTALRREEGFARFLGVAGLCTWLAVGMHNLTQDSFATPKIWLNLGMVVGVTAAWAEARRVGAREEERS